MPPIEEEISKEYGKHEPVRGDNKDLRFKLSRGLIFPLLQRPIDAD